VGKKKVVRPKGSAANPSRPTTSWVLSVGNDAG